MIRSIKLISCAAALTVIFSCATLTAFAADGDGQLTVNSAAAFGVGDEFTYEMYLADCSEDLLGIQMYVYFDTDYLKILQDSVVFDTLDGVIYNAGLDGYMTFNWTNVMDLADFSSRAGLVSMKFKVLEAGETEITYFIKQLYGDNEDYMKSYTLTYDLSSLSETASAIDGSSANAGITDDGEAVIVSEAVPIVNSDGENADKYQGNFINYLDGKGEDNTPLNAADHEAVIGVRSTIVTHPDSSAASDNSSDKTTSIIIIVVIVIILLAAASVIVVRKREDDKNKS